MKLARFVAALALLLTFALPLAAFAQATDPASVVTAFETALNAKNVDAAAAQFAPNAVIKSTSGTTTGTDQIRAFLQTLVDQNFQFQVAGNRQVTGNTETHQAQVTSDQTRKLGTGPLDATATVVVDNGKITSFTVTYAPQSLAKLQAAQASAKPAALPATGGASAVAYFVLPATLLIALGCGLKLGRAAR